MTYPYKELVEHFSEHMLYQFEANQDKDQAREEGHTISLEPSALYLQAAKHFGLVAEALANGDSDTVVNSCVHAANFLAMVAREEYAAHGFTLEPQPQPPEPAISNDAPVIRYREREQRPAPFVGRRIRPEYQEELAYQLIEYGYPHPDEDPPDVDHFQAFAHEPPADQLAFFEFLVDRLLSTKELAQLLHRSMTEEDKQ